MGLLDGILGGGNKGGGMSPITLGLLGLLAYRTFQGQGRLAEMLGTNKPAADPNANPSLPGQAPGTQQASAEPGGLGGILGQIFGNSGSAANPSAGGDLMGRLGGLFGGGAAGGVLGAGLNDLLKRFQDSGQDAKAQSWVSKGPNEEASSEDIERTVGRDTIEELAQSSGKSYQEVLDELTRDLPKTVDKLTPEGRLPTQQEVERW